QRHSDETAFGGIGCLADRLRNLTGLAVAESDPSFFVADDDKRSEAEAAPALHYFGYAVDVNEFVGEFALALFPVAAIAWFTCHDFVPSCYPSVARPLEIESAFACRVRQRLDAAMVKVAAAIKHYLLDALRGCSLGKPFSDFLRCLDIGAGL